MLPLETSEHHIRNRNHLPPYLSWAAAMWSSLLIQPCSSLRAGAASPTPLPYNLEASASLLDTEKEHTNHLLRNRTPARKKDLGRKWPHGSKDSQKDKGFGGTSQVRLKQINWKRNMGRFWNIPSSHKLRLGPCTSRFRKEQTLETPKGLPITNYMAIILFWAFDNEIWEVS